MYPCVDASYSRAVALRMLESAVAHVRGGRKVPGRGRAETCAAMSQSNSPLAMAGMIASKEGSRTFELKAEAEAEVAEVQAKAGRAAEAEGAQAEAKV